MCRGVSGGEVDPLNLDHTVGNTDFIAGCNFSMLTNKYQHHEVIESHIHKSSFSAARLNSTREQSPCS